MADRRVGAEIVYGIFLVVVFFVVSGEPEEKLFAGVSFQMLQDQGKKSDALQGEIWRIFLFGMLILLIGESVLVLPARVRADEKPILKREVAA